VYKAQDINLGREVAIKLLLEDNSSNQEATRRFINEGRILATINHRAVITVFASEVDETLSIPFLVMEYVDGVSLDKYRDEFQKDQQRLLTYFIELLEGIHSCHQKGIIHRDLKPVNILINKQGQLKIVDFGIAKIAQKQTRTGVTLGTPHYMAPEQCLGKSEITAKADVYAIGIMLWEFLTGRLPFDLDTDADDPALAIALMHLNDPPPIEKLKSNPKISCYTELLGKMLAKKPTERPDVPSIIESLKLQLGKLSRNDFENVSKNIPVSGADIIGDIYQIQELLGSGGMGRVYKAVDTTLNRIVAIKILNETSAKDDALVERFMQEGRLLATVSHPNVMNIYAASRDKITNLPFLVMEFIDGVPLNTLKEALIEDKLRIAPLMLQLFEGIAACHAKGVIHRDLKPRNIMITKDGILKILDFGIAKTSVDLTKTGIVVGTPEYMSPEQCQGVKELTPKSDIYSLGIIFWELIFGETPFKADDNKNPEVSIAMKHINATLPGQTTIPNEAIATLLPLVKRLLDKNPTKRPDIDEILEILEEFVEKTPKNKSADPSQYRKIKGGRQSIIKELIDTSSSQAQWTFFRKIAVAILFLFLLIYALGIFFRPTKVIRRDTVSNTIPGKPGANHTRPEDLDGFIKKVDEASRRFPLESDPAQLKPLFDQLTAMGEQKVADRYRRRLSDRLVQEADKSAKSNASQSLALLKKAKSVYPEITGIDDKIRNTEDALASTGIPR